MGTQGLPWVLKELQKNQGHWFYALRFIAGEDAIGFARSRLRCAIRRQANDERRLKEEKKEARFQAAGRLDDPPDSCKCDSGNPPGALTCSGHSGSERVTNISVIDPRPFIGPCSLAPLYFLDAALTASSRSVFSSGNNWPFLARPRYLAAIAGSSAADNNSP